MEHQPHTERIRDLRNQAFWNKIYAGSALATATGIAGLTAVRLYQAVQQRDFGSLAETWSDAQQAFGGSLSNLTVALGGALTLSAGLHAQSRARRFSAEANEMEAQMPAQDSAAAFGR